MSPLYSWVQGYNVPPDARPWQFAHGEHCACLLLAAAVGAGPDTVSCDYCQNVLQKRWQVTCDHGYSEAPKAPASERLRGVGALDPVKAILVRES